MGGRLVDLMNAEEGAHEQPGRHEATAGQVGWWLTYLRASGKSDRTLEGYRSALGRFLRPAPALGIPDDPARVTRHHVAAYLAALADAGQSDYTLYNRWAALSAFFGWLIAEGQLQRNPCHGLRPKRADDPVPTVTADQMQRLRALCMADSLRARELRDLQVQGLSLRWGTLPEGLRNWAMFMVLRGTGLRASELLNLELRDVDVDAGEVVVREAKGGKSRRVYLEDPVLLAVGRYLHRARGTAPALLFLPLRGTTRHMQRYQLRKSACSTGTVPASTSTRTCSGTPSRCRTCWRAATREPCRSCWATSP